MTAPLSRDSCPEVRHHDCSPVMLIGHGSSGTSITASMIRKYLRISFGTESQFIPRYYRRIGEYGDLHVDDDLRRLIGNVLEERWFVRCRKFGFATTVDAVFDDIRERSLAGVLESVFRQLARHNQMDRWGDKSPEYVHHLPMLKALFPDAYFLHVVRDGRDVALSVFDEFWGAKNVVAAALDWRTAVEKVRDFARTVAPERFLEVRYEDLLSQPRETFARLIEFLRIENPADRLLDAIEGPLCGELKRTNFNKWKTQFSPRQQQKYESINGDLLAHYGYETRVSRASAVRPLEAAFWNFESRLAQFTRLDYWKDNVYKLELRTKDLLRSLRRVPQPPAAEPATTPGDRIGSA